MRVLVRKSRGIDDGELLPFIFDRVSLASSGGFENRNSISDTCRYLGGGGDLEISIYPCRRESIAVESNMAKKVPVNKGNE